MSAAPDHDVVPFDKHGSQPARRVRMRASDADRQATVHLLQDALARGQLGFEEAGDRMSEAWRTRYLADLEPLTADLPPAAARPATPGWAALAQMALAQLQATLTRAFPGGLRSARGRAAVVAALLALLLFVVVAGTTLHALFDGGHGFGDGDWNPHPHPPFGGP